MRVRFFSARIPRRKLLTSLEALRAIASSRLALSARIRFFSSAFSSVGVFSAIPVSFFLPQLTHSPQLALTEDFIEVTLSRFRFCLRNLPIHQFIETCSFRHPKDSKWSGERWRRETTQQESQHVITFVMDQQVRFANAVAEVHHFQRKSLEPNAAVFVLAKHHRF